MICLTADESPGRGIFFFFGNHYKHKPPKKEQHTITGDTMGLFGFGKKTSQEQTIKRLKKDEHDIHKQIHKMNKEERKILAQESDEMKLINEAEALFNKGKLGIHKLIAANIPLKELDDAIEEYAEDMYDAEKRMNKIAIYLANFQNEAEMLNKLGIKLEQKAKEISSLTKSNYTAEFDALANTDHLVLEMSKSLVGQIRTIESTIKTIYLELEELIRSKNEQEVHQKLMQEYNTKIQSVEKLFLNVKQAITRIIVVSKQVQQRLHIIQEKDKQLQEFIKREEQEMERKRHYKGGFEPAQLRQMRK